MEISMRPVGFVTSSRAEALDDDWDHETATITLDPGIFDDEALRGLDQFSHAEIIYFFDQVTETKITYGARHPRGNTDWPQAGIFAQRGKNRPNRIGATIVRVLRVEGTTLVLSGLDAIDGTPVLDIKPFMLEFGPRGEIRQPEWATEIMREYW